MKKYGVQFMLRLRNEEQAAALDQIAVEQGFVGGKGVRKGVPNRSAAARFLMAQADERMK